MYFGVLAVGADVTGGFLAMRYIQGSTSKIALIFKDFKTDGRRNPTNNHRRLHGHTQYRPTHRTHLGLHTSSRHNRIPRHDPRRQHHAHEKNRPSTHPGKRLSHPATRRQPPHAHRPKTRPNPRRLPRLNTHFRKRPPTNGSITHHTNKSPEPLTQSIHQKSDHLIFRTVPLPTPFGQSHNQEGHHIPCDQPKQFAENQPSLFTYFYS